MNRAQVHRGPDGEGVWRADGVVFGHRRLSILDLSDDAAQPMRDAPSGVVLTYNGEIYNYVELRDSLRAKGHSFRSSGDTEVLLKAYLEWGLDMLPRLNGMFAFAIFDPRQGCLILARDQIGQKPLFYWQAPDRLAFASELTALLRHPGIERTIDREALVHYLVHEAYPAPHTPLQGVRKLPPQHCLRYDIASGEATLRRWEAALDKPQPATREAPTREDEDRLEDVLREAVARHLRSDVPVGVYLSGGVDSSTMALFASDVLGGERVHTYTVASSEPSFDESDLARRTAGILGTRHHETVLTPERLLETIPGILAGMDEPLADPGLVAVHQVARYVRDHVKVVLSGDGGDELMCGYPPFAKWGLGDRLAALPTSLLRGIVQPLARQLPAQYGYMGLAFKAQLFARGLDRPAAVRNAAWIGSFLPEEIADLLGDPDDIKALAPDANGIPGVWQPLADLHRLAREHDALSRLGYEYQLNYLAHCICAHTDKANMAHSVEARSPFLDRQVIRHLRAMPSSWKLRQGRGKWLLRRLLERRIGPHVSAKPKQGFTVPLALWLRGPLRELGESLLAPDRIASAGLFRPEAVTRMWERHQNGRQNLYKPLWTLIVLQHWLDSLPAPVSAAGDAPR